MKRLDETILLVRSTGKALLERLSCVELNIRRKDNHHGNLVTDFDVWVQNELEHGLKKIEPTANFFAEEQENTEVEGLTWFVDPIDGTTNFVSTQKNFAISVALYDGKAPIFGIVYDVVNDVCYHAMKDAGAFKNGEKIKKREPVLLENALVDASLTTINFLSERSAAPLHTISRALRGHRALGCASLAMCHIATGELDGYISYHLYPWDYAAAGIILRECGGMFTSIYGEALFGTESAAILCSGDGEMEARLLPFLRGEIGIEALMPQ